MMQWTLADVGSEPVGERWPPADAIAAASGFRPARAPAGGEWRPLGEIGTMLPRTPRYASDLLPFGAAREPARDGRAYDAFNAGAQWIADKLGPAIPPELRPKLRALGEVAHMISPATAYQGYDEALRHGRYGEAALNAFALIPAEAIAAGIAKFALPAVPGLAPNFIVSRGGTVLPVPEGAVGPSAVTNRKGIRTGSAFTGGAGGPGGLDPRTDGLRLMDPRTKGPYQYPRGYGAYMNESGQTINPFTGRTVERIDPLAHIPFE
jgi:hypothetical protein